MVDSELKDERGKRVLGYYLYQYDVKCNGIVNIEYDGRGSGISCAPLDIEYGKFITEEQLPKQAYKTYPR
jgi:hypothetical protein